jgi:hypothetical protein
MNAQTRSQLSWKNEHHWIFFEVLHTFEKNKDEDDKQKKKISFEKESSSNQSTHVDDILTKNSRKFFTIVIKMLFRKEVNCD